MGHTVEPSFPKFYIRPPGVYIRVTMFRDVRIELFTARVLCRASYVLKYSTDTGSSYSLQGGNKTNGNLVPHCGF